MEITVHVSTKGRYFTTLPLFLVSVANQTLKPQKVIIYDDNIPQQDLRKHPLYEYIFGLFHSKRIDWAVSYGKGIGQIHNHQKAIEECKTNFLYKGDDDIILDANVLEELASQMTDKVGAVAPLVLHPNRPILDLPSYYSYNKIEYCEDPSQLNIQWFRHPDGKVKSVDHLYSTFLYRKEAAKHGYHLELSPVAHREESLFTYEMKRAGWGLLVNPKAVVNHFRYSEGGIRGQYHSQENFDHDTKIFLDKLNEWGVVLKKKKLVVADMGLGDSLVLRRILPDIINKYGDVVLAVCYPEVFEDYKNIEIISIAQAHLIENIDKYDVYKKMWDNTEKHWTLEQGFRNLYEI